MSRPASTASAAGMCSTSSSPYAAPPDSGSKSRKTTLLPKASARARNRFLSPNTAQRQGRRANAKSKQISGPMPAGSPEVTAKTGCFIVFAPNKMRF
ncbi:hypothetical protein NM95_2190 [Neisseria meningitidis NM95]|nr:hypothetical protein NM95_2190 [Neisseria meningitidis NM95]